MPLEQLTLNFDAPAIAPTPRESEASTQARFEAWLAASPEVWEAFRNIACRLRDHGRKRISVKYVVEIMREDFRIETERHDGWRIDNRFTSRLARKLVEEDASFAALVELRPLTKE